MAPRFSLIRSFTQCAWAIRDDVPPEQALELAQVAGTEPPLSELRSPPLHAQSYLAVAGGQPGEHGALGASETLRTMCGAS